MTIERKSFKRYLKRRWFLIGLAVTLSLLIFGLNEPKYKVLATESGKIPVKAVIVTIFEIGKDTGDIPGEFQNWVEKENLNQIYPLPIAYHDIRSNGNGLIGIVTGQGKSNAASSIMALGRDPRFDLTKAYWLIAGIAGIDPEDGSLASAAWAEYVVDGDLANEIDSRQIPASWPYGYFPQGSGAPNVKPSPTTFFNTVYHLNPNLVEWAYQLTKCIQPDDSPSMADYRAQYTGFPNAQKPPFVLKGDDLAADTFWFGRVLNQWANDWVKLWTDGKGNYVTSVFEDTGILQSLTNLSKGSLIDLNRVLVLRTASDYTSPAPNQDTTKNFATESVTGNYPDGGASFSSAYKVGSAVIHDILNHWHTYEHKIPGS